VGLPLLLEHFFIPLTRKNLDLTYLFIFT